MGSRSTSGDLIDLSAYMGLTYDDLKIERKDGLYQIEIDAGKIHVDPLEGVTLDQSDFLFG